MKSTNPSINTVLILGAGELGLPVLRAMSRQARLHHALNISVLLRPEAARAVTGPHRARRDAGAARYRRGGRRSAAKQRG